MSASVITERLRALLEESAPFSSLPAEERGELLQNITVEFFEPGDVVLGQNSSVHKGLYIVESGLVRLMDIEQRRLLDKCIRGDTFGSLGLLRGGQRVYEARALEPTVCAVLDARRFQQLSEARPEIAAFFERDLNQYIRRLDTSVDVAGALLFSRPLREFDHRSPVTCAPETTAQEAARLMEEQSRDVLIVVRGEQPVGLVTDRVLRNLVARGRPADTPVRRIMAAPIPTIEAEATLFEAMMALLAQPESGVVITKGSGKARKPVAVLTDRDLAYFRGLDPVTTVRHLDTVTAVNEFGQVRSEISEQLLRLYQQRVSPEHLGRIGAAVYDRMLVRLLKLVEAGLRRERRHAAVRVELKWAWLRLGNGGRQEMALNSMQHNALVYTDPASDEEAERARQWFGLITERANRALEGCGFPAGAVVARDPRWHQPLSRWKQRVHDWIREADPDALQDMLLSFDLRGVYGELNLVDDLKQEMRAAIIDEENSPAFFRVLVADALKHGPPQSLLRRLLQDRFSTLVTNRHAFNIRERGVLPVIRAARVLALEVPYLDSTNTFDRLHHVAAVSPELAGKVRSALDAYQYLVDFRLEHQMNANTAGEDPDDELDVVALTTAQQHLLRDALGAVADLHNALAERYELL